MADEFASLSFEEALEQLEKIVRDLESGQQKLEDAISAYERGATLRAHCEKKLNEAEVRLQTILKKTDGTIELHNADQPQ